MKMLKRFIIFFFILCFISPLQALDEYYTIQTGSFKSLQEAERKYTMLEKKLPPKKRDFLRIELVKGYYTLRIGKFSSFREAKKLLPEIKELFPSSIILKAYILDERIKKLYRYKEIAKKVEPALGKEKKESLKTEDRKIEKQLQQTQEQVEKIKKIEPVPTKKKTYVPISKVIPLKFLLSIVFIVVIGFVMYYNRRRIAIMVEEITGLNRGVKRIVKKGLDKDYRDSCLETPRYLSTLFVERVKNIIQDIDINKMELPAQIKIDRPIRDSLWICRELDSSLRKSTETVVVFNDLVVSEGEKIIGEILVKGDVRIHGEATVRSIVAEGEINMDKKGRVIKYLDADLGIKVQSDCILGETISTGGELYIGKGCKFNCLYGRPIRTYNFTSTIQMLDTENLTMLQSKHLNVPVKFLKNSLLFTKQELIIPELIRANKNIVTTEGLTINKGCVINGYIKAQKDIVIHDNVLINGDVYSYGSLIIGRNVRVYGSVTSKGRIVIDSGVRIGGRDKEVKIVSSGEIEIMENVEIYGTVYTDKGGKVI